MERLLSNENQLPLEGVWQVYATMEYSGIGPQGRITPNSKTDVGQVIITHEGNNTYIEQILSLDQNVCTFPLGEQTAYFVLDEKNKITSIHKVCGRGDAKYLGKLVGNTMSFNVYTGKRYKQTIIQKLIYEKVEN